MHKRRCAYLLLFSLIAVSADQKDDTSATISKSADDATCSNQQECLELDMVNWLESSKNSKESQECTIKEDGQKKKNVASNPVFTIAKDCDQEGAIWYYKYTGSKGKKKRFKGKGKLLFSKHSSPPHGYDYGMKSGICLVLSDPNIKGVEANFDDNSIAQGQGVLSFHDGRVVKGTFVDGRIHGMAREYEPELDKHTNIEKSEKRLCAISVYEAGNVGVGKWTLREDGTVLFYPIIGDTDKKLTLAIIPGANDTRQLILGELDDEDMMLGAVDARLTGLKDRDCLKVPEVEPLGERYDYDLEVKSKVNAATAKFIRFFELVANEKKSLHSHYKVHAAPVDTKNSRKLLDIVGRDAEFRVFKIITPDGNGQAVTDGSKLTEGMPKGPQTIKILTDWRRRDVLPIARKKKEEAEEAERIRKELQEEKIKKDNMGTDERMYQDEEDDKKEEDKGDKPDDDMAKIDSLLQDDNNTMEMTSEDYEAHMDEFLPFDMLPYRPRQWLKKIVQIRGVFDDESQLQGPVTVLYGDGTSLEGLVVNGTLHGIARHLDAPIKKGRRKRYVRKQVENMVIAVATGMMQGNEDPPKEVNFVGSYKNGYIDGPGWKFLVGGTFLFGDLKRTLEFTTEHGAFINQDLLTSYLGSFKDGKMVSARPAKIVGGIEDPSGVRVPKFSDPDETAPVMRFLEQEPGQLLDRTVPDPTEENWVRVGPSTLGPEAGDGLFATKIIPENTVVAFYGGYRISAKDWNSTKPLDPHYWMKVDSGGLEDSGSVMYLPDEVGADTAKYRATLGHKINHSFTKWNCVFHSLDHPRFGLIPAARVVDSIPEGRELLCLYEYEFHDAAPWYQELWRRDIDSDFVYGPFGHRGSRRNGSEPIGALLDNGTLYNEFRRHAVEVLGLEPVT